MWKNRVLVGHIKAGSSTAPQLPATAPRGIITTYQGMQLDLASPFWRFHLLGFSIDWGKWPISDPNLLNATKRYLAWMAANRAESTIQMTWRGMGFLTECPSFIHSERRTNGSDGTITHETFIELKKACLSKSVGYSQAFIQVRRWYKWCLDRRYQGFSASEWPSICAIDAEQSEPYRALLGPSADETPLTPMQKRELYEALKTARQVGILPVNTIVVIWLIFYRGIRPEEVARIIEADLKRAGNHFMVWVPYVKKRTPRRKGGGRDLRIPPFLGMLIERIIRNHQNGRVAAGIPEASSERWPLFPRKEPMPGMYHDPIASWLPSGQQFSRWICSAGERLDLSFKLNAHRLRNTFALDLVLRGASPEELRIELGHATDKHILRYFHPGDSQVEMIDAVETERLGDVFRALATNMIDADQPRQIGEAPRTRIRFGDPAKGIYVGVGECGCKGSNCAVGLANTLNCYTCTQFCPFRQGKHELVLRQVNDTIDEMRLRGAEESDITIWRKYRKGVGHVIELCNAWRPGTKPRQEKQCKVRRKGTS